MHAAAHSHRSWNGETTVRSGEKIFKSFARTNRCDSSIRPLIKFSWPFRHRCSPGAAPGPVADFGHVLAVDIDVLAMFDELVAHHLSQVFAGGAELRGPVDDVVDQVVAVQPVLHSHVE